MTTTDPRIAQLSSLESKNAALENEIGDNADPIDFLGAIQMIADSEDSLLAFLETNLYKDLLHYSQSNPERTHAMVLEWAKRDEEISELDDAITSDGIERE